MSEKILFIFNPYAGKSQIASELVWIIDIFTRNGYEVVAYPTQSPLDGMKKVMQDGEQYKLIVVSGGDGTLSEVVEGFMKLPSYQDKRIGYIPAGSTNDFAISLGLPKNMREAAQVVVNGVPFECDIGKFNNHTFNYVAAFGAFTDVSYETPQANKNILGHLAYIIEGISRLPNLFSYAMKINCDGKEINGEFLLGMIMNTKSVAGINGGNVIKADLSDGMFEVLLIRTPQNLIALQNVIAGILRGDSEGDGFVLVKAKNIVIDTEDDIKWTLDGEYGGNDKHTEISIIQKAVKFMIDSNSELTNQ